MLNPGLCMLFRLTPAPRCTLLKDPLDTLLRLGSSLIMLIKQCSNFSSPLSWDILIGETIVSASKLCKHLSDDLKDKLMTRSDSYALVREYLVSNYG